MCSFPLKQVQVFSGFPNSQIYWFV